MYTSRNGNNNSNSPAKRRANAVHNRLKTLCHNWMVKHRPELADRLRERARREIKVKEEAR